MREPTRDDVDALVGPATPHFAYQLRARVRELVEDLPEDHDVRRYAEEKMELLDRLGHASSKADEGPREPREAAGLGGDPELRAGGRAAARGDELRGQSVLVTGGSRGIGRAIALRFASDGAARVAIGYLRNDRAAEETAEELRAAGAEPVLVRGNVASERVAREVAELGPFDVLVHNAATGVIRPALETEDKHWDWTVAANARALLVAGARGRAGDAARARRSSASRASARSACSRTTCSSASRRPRSSRSSATSRSSSPRAGSASTPSPAGSSRRARSTTSRTASR